MNARNKIASVLGGAAMLATVVGMTAGLAPAAAAPKPSGANLDIVQDPQHANNYILYLHGHFPMEQPDAQGYLNNINTGSCGERGTAGMFYYITGDDGNGQHILSRHFPGAKVNNEGSLRASSRGLEYSAALPIRKGFLDEDAGNDVDEIYVGVAFEDADCARRVQYSNVVSRSF